MWLRVKDKEGAWSDPHVRALSTVNENLPPVAMFTVNPSTQVEGRAIEITDQSYDPNGDPIAEWRWRVRKGGGSWSGLWLQSANWIFLHLAKEYTQ